LGGGLSSDVYRLADDRVVKLYRATVSQKNIEAEWKATSVAFSAGLPAPAPLERYRSGDRQGIIFSDAGPQSMLRVISRQPWRMAGALSAMARLHACVHTQSSADSGLPQQQGVLRRKIGDARVPDAVKQQALAALNRLPDGDRFCHGDLHPDNVMLKDGALTLIDWEKALCGVPAADVARTEMLIRHGLHKPGRLERFFAPIMPVSVRDMAAWWYLRSYCSASGMSLTDIAAWRLPVWVASLSGYAHRGEPQLLEAVLRLAAAQKT